jgi:hypothetical protein
VNKEDPEKLKAGGIERTEEGELPQGREREPGCPTRQRRKPGRTTPRPTDPAAVQRPAGDLRPGEGRARPVAIQPGGVVSLGAGAVAGHSTESTWLDGRQKSARLMGTAGCATKDQDRAARAALG